VGRASELLNVRPGYSSDSCIRVKTLPHRYELSRITIWEHLMVGRQHNGNQEEYCTPADVWSWRTFAFSRANATAGATRIYRHVESVSDCDESFTYGWQVRPVSKKLQVHVDPAHPCLLSQLGHFAPRDHACA